MDAVWYCGRTGFGWGMGVVLLLLCWVLPSFWFASCCVLCGWTGHLNVGGLGVLRGVHVMVRSYVETLI